MNTNDYHAAVRHEAGHAVIAHALEWIVEKCQVRELPSYIQVRKPDDFNLCPSVWQRIDEGPDQPAYIAAERMGKCCRRPLVKGVLFLMSGEVFEHMNPEKIKRQLFNGALFCSNHYADANKIRDLNGMWKGIVAGSSESLLELIIGRHLDEIIKVANPMAARAASLLANDGTISHSALLNIFESSASQAQDLRRVLQVIIDRYGAMT